MNELRPKCERLIGGLAHVARLRKDDAGRGPLWQTSLNSLNAVHAPRRPRSVKQAGALAAYLGRGFGLMYQSRSPLRIGVATLDESEPEIRGMQWRLVMWQAGFEQVRHALTLGGDKSSSQQDLPEHPSAAILRCNKAIASLVSVPFEALHGGTAADDIGDVIEFLRLGKRHALADWVRGAQGPTSWLGVVELAAEVRHATVHGALSARKVHQWQLTAGMHEMLRRLDMLTDAIDSQLAADPPGRKRTAKVKGE